MVHTDENVCYTDRIYIFTLRTKAVAKASNTTRRFRAIKCAKKCVLHLNQFHTYRIFFFFFTFLLFYSFTQHRALCVWMRERGVTARCEMCHVQRRRERGYGDSNTQFYNCTKKCVRSYLAKFSRVRGVSGEFVTPVGQPCRIVHTRRFRKPMRGRRTKAGTITAGAAAGGKTV